MPNLENTDFIFLNLFGEYYLDYNVDYFNRTSSRYTNVTFYNNGSKSSSQNILKVFHSQNLTPYLNIAFKYNIVNSIGDYKNQTSKNNFLNLHYSYNKNRISPIIQIMGCFCCFWIITFICFYPF
ncbi:MAG: hypothetical protein DRH51_01125 [Candidatus Coatesbacteria bacterium]|nr:MAG: hypothetical protein DRH51_01125 [Candidatus Coatesbacteria bacterium]